jgi:hypothetical protein
LAADDRTAADMAHGQYKPADTKRSTSATTDVRPTIPHHHRLKCVRLACAARGFGLLKFYEDASIIMRKSKSEAAHGRDRKQCFQEETGMSSPISSQGPIQASGPALAVGSAKRIASSGGVGPTERTATVTSSVSLDALPSSPPPEVLDQMASAAHAYDELLSQGRELRFARDEQSGRTAVEVRDRAGNVLKTISPSQALELAAGAPLE